MTYSDSPNIERHILPQSPYELEDLNYMNVDVCENEIIHGKHLFLESPLSVSRKSKLWNVGVRPGVRNLDNCAFHPFPVYIL